METIEKIKLFAELVQKQQLARMNAKMPQPDYPDFWLRDATTKIRAGRKYTKVDVGASGKFMVVNETGKIFGIKAYGVIHRGKRYGTLDTINQYYWGNYSPTAIATTESEVKP